MASLGGKEEEKSSGHAKDLTAWTTSNNHGRVSVITYTDDNNENLEMDLCSDGFGTIILENYKVLKLIGRGTSSKVFLALHKQTNNLVAIKCFRKDTLID